MSIASCLLITALWTAPPTSAALAPLESVPIHAEPGAPVTIPFVADGEKQNYLVVVGSMALSGESSEVLFQSRAVPPAEAMASPLPIANLEIPDWWRRRVAKDREQMDRARRGADTHEAYSVARFAQTKSFHLFVGEDNLHDVRKYIAIDAQLAHVGKHCLIYTDRSGVDPALIDDVARTFDDKVYPTTRATFGVHRDVDRDGKFTILLTAWLNRLSDGKVSLSGFVRGADFYRDVEAPYSNHCDMLYLNATLPIGAHMRTVLAHEYTHAITFSEHTFSEYLPGGQGQDEEAWLGEGLAHLAENVAGEGWSNLDYRISNYLSEPNAHRLVVPDYFTEGLWRSHGCRGATYLFLRYLVDRFGPGLLGELSRSNIEGIQNIEVATQKRFAQLFRDWSTSLATSAAVGQPMAGGLTSVSLHGRLGERLLAGAQITTLGETDHIVSLAPTSWASVKVTLEPGEARDIQINAAPNAELIVTLVRLPGDLVETLLQPMPVAGSTEVTLDLATSAPVRWQSITWERLHLRQQNARDNEKLARILPAAELMESSQNQQGWTSDPIDLSEFEGDAVVFRALGIDETGRFVTAWGVHAPTNMADETALRRDRAPETRITR